MSEYKPLTTKEIEEEDAHYHPKATVSVPVPARPQGKTKAEVAEFYGVSEDWCRGAKPPSIFKRILNFLKGWKMPRIIPRISHYPGWGYKLSIRRWEDVRYNA